MTELGGYDSRVKTETIHRMDAFDLEALLNEQFPQLEGLYDFVAAEECSNDSAQTFTVDGELSDYARDYDLPDIEAGNWQYRTGIYLDELCRRAVIPPGKYVVEVSW